MTKDEALKMALKALRIAQMELASSREDAEEFGDEGIWDEYDYAMNAIRQALDELDNLLKVAKEIVSNAEEYEFPDGLGVGISMDFVQTTFLKSSLG